MLVSTHRRRLAAALAGTALVIGTFTTAPAAGTAADESVIPDLAEVVQPLVDDAAAVGIRVSVGLRDVSDDPGETALVGSPAPYNPASTIKLALLATVMRQADRGLLNLDAPITVSPYMVVGGSGTIQDEEMPFTATVRELAHRMVIVSDNTATNVLLYYVGIPTVQELLDDLGLEVMRFNRQMFPGDLLSHVPTNVIDAADTVELLTQIYSGDLLSDTATEQVLEWMRAQEVDTKFGAVLNDAPVAHKTGETGNVTHDVGYFLVPGHEAVVTVFTEVTTTSSFSEAQRIGNPVVQRIGLAVYEYLAAAAGEPVAEDPRMITLTARSACVDGTARVTVRTVSAERATLDVRLSTPFGAEKVTGLRAHGRAEATFDSGEPAIAAGTAAVTAELFDGVAHYQRYAVPYRAIDCT